MAQQRKSRPSLRRGCQVYGRLEVATMSQLASHAGELPSTTSPFTSIASYASRESTTNTNSVDIQVRDEGHIALQPGQPWPTSSQLCVWTETSRDIRGRHRRITTAATIIATASQPPGLLDKHGGTKDEHLHVKRTPSPAASRAASYRRYRHTFSSALGRPSRAFQLTLQPATDLTASLRAQPPFSSRIPAPTNLIITTDPNFAPHQTFVARGTAGIPAAQISDMMLKGTSMPAKLGAPSGGHTSSMSQQEVKRKRRRESHNLVERRRRDNINERIQDLSKLVPSHRLEDEKIRKAIQNGTPLSPTIGSISSPTQATSGLAGPGARRAAGGTAGNITTGLPLEDKDKGPNKGDILNGAVSWTRDLMWMLHLKIQQQEELMNALQDHGGVAPFEVTEDERRMQTELTETMARMEETTGAVAKFSYSRTAGSGLRVPHHTDYKGEPLNGHGIAVDHASISPGVIDTSAVAVGVLDNGDYYDGGDILDFEDDSGDLHDMNFKEEDEFGMDLTH
ncbi:hypothetical protein P8C59_007431 [Phyllachora maydis]|uniref:BHLH domain-containing protein n=1 Tax=Phyllachora maydis TaxID=1825666 RepID=A0AAD9MGW1_9PEZI|nr:hypothetical protein P8C59_007431 [Phyllachora maydis]